MYEYSCTKPKYNINKYIKISILYNNNNDIAYLKILKLLNTSL